MKFINDSSLNYLVGKINSIFRIDSKNKIRHDDLSTRLFQGEKIILRKNNVLYFDSNGKVGGDNSQDKAIKISRCDDYHSFITIKNNNFKTYYHPQGANTTYHFEIKDGQIENQFDWYQSGTSKFRSCLNDENNNIGTTIQGGLITSHALFINRIYNNNSGRQNEQMLTLLAPDYEGGQNNYEALQLRHKEQLGNYITNIALKGNVMANYYNIRAVNELHSDYIACDEAHFDTIYTQYLENKGIFYSSYSNNGDYNTIISQVHNNIKLATRQINITRQLNKIYLESYVTSQNKYRNNIFIHAGRSSKIEMISETPKTESRMNKTYDNSGERINIYGSIYFPHAEENIPGVTTSNYTTAQLNTLSNTPLQGIILDLLKQNESLQNQIDTLINQLNNLS